MTNHATLSYSGRMPVETNDDGTIPQTERDKLHALLDDSIGAYEGSTVTLRSAVIHFERDGSRAGGDMPRAHVDLEARGDLTNLDTIEGDLATKVVGIGLESDLATAKDAIEVN